MSTEKDMDLLLQDYAANHLPGCGCIVMRDGQILYEGYTGYADLATGRKVDGTTIFRLYSMTKVIVCAGAMILFERGKFALNDPYSDYFPEWKDVQVAEQTGNGSYVYRAPHRPLRVKDVFNMACGLPYPSPNGEHPTDKAMNEVRAKLNEQFGGKYTVS
ncbi:MAG: beta-lactamase family protein, partial [Clostridiales bacterium]|nr:beta-lactamase family protein [Clostridiales bacterium]